MILLDQEMTQPPSHVFCLLLQIANAVLRAQLVQTDDREQDLASESVPPEIQL